MKKLTVIPMMLISILALSMPLFAATTVTVDDNNRVTIDQNQPHTMTMVQQVVPQTIVVQQVPVIVAETQDPRKLEGEIIRVDMPESLIVVRDINSRERKVLLKQGMISGYKVDDYVQIYLMADLKEAKTIKTIQTADLDGEVVSADYSRNLLVVHDGSGMDRVVILSPGMNNKYQVKDHVRLYVIADQPDAKEVRLIRVK